MTDGHRPASRTEQVSIGIFFIALAVAVPAVHLVLAGEHARELIGTVGHQIVLLGCAIFAAFGALIAIPTSAGGALDKMSDFLVKFLPFRSRGP